MVLLECFLSDMFCITTKVVHKLLPLQLFMVTTNNINKKVDFYSFLVFIAWFANAGKRSKCKRLIN